MNLRTVLLGFLMRGERSGYELKAEMEESVGFFFGGSYGSIYPALRDLESEGLVWMEEEIQSGRPNRKAYRITPEGEERFYVELGEPPAGDSFRSEFLMRLFFGARQSPEKLLEHIAEYRSYQERKLEELETVRQRVEEVASPYEMMCLRFGLTSFESNLRWLDEVEAEVRTLDGVETDMGAG